MTDEELHVMMQTAADGSRKMTRLFPFVTVFARQEAIFQTIASNLKERLYGVLQRPIVRC